MSSKRYAEEFKIEAVKKVTDRGHSAPDVTYFDLCLFRPVMTRYRKLHQPATAPAPPHARPSAPARAGIRPRCGYRA